MKKTILEAALAGDQISFNDPGFAEINAINQKNAKLRDQLNHHYQTHETTIDLMSKMTNQAVDPSNDFNLPFRTDFGQHIFFGKNDFINQNCMFVDLGGIYLGDQVLLGPNVTILTVNHEEDPVFRRNLYCKAVRIGNGVWVGANATVLPGVTIGENAIIGAGALVTKDVPAETVVVGSPARIVRKIRRHKSAPSDDVQ